MPLLQHLTLLELVNKVELLISRQYAALDCTAVLNTVSKCMVCICISDATHYSNMMMWFWFLQSKPFSLFVK